MSAVAKSSHTNAPARARCHWDWCTDSFPTREELIEHVENDHIAHAQPVQRGDVPMLRRAEGDSVKLSWTEWSYSTVGSASEKGKEREVQVAEKGVMTESPSGVAPMSISTTPPPPSAFQFSQPNLVQSTPRRAHESSSSQSQMQSIPPPHPAPSFTAIRGPMNTPPPESPATGMLTFPAYRVIQSSSASPLKNASQGVVSPGGSPSESQIPSHQPDVPGMQWRPQSQLALGSFPSTIDPSQLLVTGDHAPPASPSTLDITYGSSSSDERRANLHQNLPNSSWTSNSDERVLGLPYEEGYGFGYGEVDAQTQLQTQAHMNDIVSSSSQ